MEEGDVQITLVEFSGGKCDSLVVAPSRNVKGAGINVRVRLRRASAPIAEYRASSPSVARDVALVCTKAR